MPITFFPQDANSPESVVGNNDVTDTEPKLTT